MKVFLHYKDHLNADWHKTLKITLPKSWKYGPTSKLLGQFVESYNGNETLKSSNELDESTLHLALLPEENDSVSTTSSTTITWDVEWNALPSDAITIECIPDRADIYVRHGPSRTLGEIEEERNAKLEQERLERERTVACVNFGCKKRFPRGGPYPECTYHAAPPVFHETAKFWSCCPNKKAYDWEEFQSIRGCQSGTCTDVKPDGNHSKQFLGGSDLREAAGDVHKLKSIDDYNKSQEAGGSDAAPVLHRLRQVFAELDIEHELFDQVVNGIKQELGTEEEEESGDKLDEVATHLGKKLKSAMKAIAAEQLRIK